MAHTIFFRTGVSTLVVFINYNHVKDMPKRDYNNNNNPPLKHIPPAQTAIPLTKEYLYFNHREIALQQGDRNAAQDAF